MGTKILEKTDLECDRAAELEAAGEGRSSLGLHGQHPAGGQLGVALLGQGSYLCLV